MKKKISFSGKDAILNINWDGTMYVSFLNRDLGRRKIISLMESNFPLRRVVGYLYASHHGWLVQRLKDAVKAKDFTLAWRNSVFIG